MFIMNVLKRDLEFLFRSAVAVSALLESSQKLYSIFDFGLKETEKYQNLNGFSPRLYPTFSFQFGSSPFNSDHNRLDFSPFRSPQIQ